MSLSGVTVVTKSATGVTSVLAVVDVTGVLVPSLPGVGVVTVAVLVSVPGGVALLMVPLIKTDAEVFTLRSGRVALPDQVCHVEPLSVLYCGFSIALRSWSLIFGALAVAGPALLTVMV